MIKRIQEVNEKERETAAAASALRAAAKRSYIAGGCNRICLRSVETKGLPPPRPTVHVQDTARPLAVLVKERPPARALGGSKCVLVHHA